MLTVDYDRLDLRPGMTVLDLGCGEGRHAFEAYRRGASVVALDWGVSEVETTKRWLGAIAEAGEAAGGLPRYEVVRGDLLALPFPDASVDRVMASEVLEHIPDDVTAMAEISRVLKPGGRAVVTVPRYGPERICWALSDEYHANEGGHIRIYTAPVVRDPARLRGPDARRQPPRPRAARAVLVAEVRGGRDQGLRARPRLPPAAGLGPDEAAVAHPHGRAAPRPAVRQEPRRLRRQARGPPTAPQRRSRRRRPVGVGADRCRALRPAALPELPGVLTGGPGADDRRLDRRRSRTPDGALPWFRGGQLDPWDSVEAAMALDLGGEHDRARAAYRWLAAPAAPGRLLGRRVPRRARRPRRPPRATTPATSPSAPGTAGCSPATSGWSAELWPAVRRGLDLVTRMQLPGGAIGWALRPDGTPDGTALLTGNASLFQALRCGIALAGLRGEPQPDWELAVTDLGDGAAHPARGLRRPVALLDGLVLPGARPAR